MSRFEMTVFHPNGTYYTIQASERWMLEQEAMDMEGLGNLYIIDELSDDDEDYPF